MTTTEIYRDQVTHLLNRVIDAAIATNCGAGGENGKRFDGKFYHQHVAQYKAAAETLRRIEAGENPLAMLGVTR